MIVFVYKMNTDYFLRLLAVVIVAVFAIHGGRSEEIINKNVENIVPVTEPQIDFFYQGKHARL